MNWVLDHICIHESESWAMKTAEMVKYHCLLTNALNFKPCYHPTLLHKVILANLAYVYENQVN